MTDSTTKPEDSATAPAASNTSSASSSSILSSVGIGTILSAVLATIGAVAGAGWPGVIALAAVGLGGVIGGSFLVKLINDRADVRDQDRAGTDAGSTAVDLANQDRGVSEGMDAAEKASPPTAGFTKSP